MTSQNAKIQTAFVSDPNPDQVTYAQRADTADLVRAQYSTIKYKTSNNTLTTARTSPSAQGEANTPEVGVNHQAPSSTQTVYAIGTTPPISTIDRDTLPSNITSLLVPKPASKASFVVLKEWEGYVTAIGTDDFEARLTEILGDTATENYAATLPLSDLSDEDRADIQPGSIFRWTIGYSINKTKTRKRTSEIVFRRLPRWSARELKEARELGEKRSERLNWE